MSASIELNWEWPADRAPEEKLLVLVNTVKKEGSGLFGLKKSPSLVSSIPDPMIVEATVVSSNSAFKGQTIRVVVPKLEIEGITVNTYAVLGVVESSTCICIVAVASKDVDLNTVNCL